MKNFIFLSPNFPPTYWQFCRELRNNGLRVLGIGDAPYDELLDELKGSLDEYYKVGSLENYDEVYRAVAFFAFKYGRIDYLESNNEYWLERDAKLRDDFNVSTGFHSKDMTPVKFKSKMKANYEKAGIPVARYYLVEDLEGCKKFIKKVGYPVIAKPDNGVGASGTYKINNLKELKAFLEDKPDELYIMEEFIDATITSYDAIVDSHSNPIFETGNVTPVSLLEVVNNMEDSCFYIRKEIPEDLRARGRAALKSFGVKSRMVHFEFFTLNCDQHIGKKGDIVALEVNMRPSGGISPNMMNFAHHVNIFKIWADMIAYDSSEAANSDYHAFCGFLGRRDGLEHKMSDEQLLKEYADHLVLSGRVEDALSGAMGNRMFICNFDTEKELMDFYKKTFELK
ncbi:MAG: ATP-grasp domain-containing protein [Erysipelotrichaceae bacterium]|nr:ATP-grasp domain-containing protein [Erysipelotrichaceae bacterium]